MSSCENAVTEMGTSCKLSDRFVAVTTTSSNCCAATGRDTEAARRADRPRVTLVAFTCDFIANTLTTYFIYLWLCSRRAHLCLLVRNISKGEAHCIISVSHSDTTVLFNF